MEKAARAVLTHGRLWYRIDAKGQRPGKLASSVASILMGKYKPTYDGGADVGDHVVIVNTKHVQFSGAKWKDKLYRKHTSFPGGFSETEARHLHRDYPTRVVELAVKGMMPKNKLRNRRLERLHLFEAEENPYEDDIYADVELPQSDDDTSSLPTDILRPGAELHVIEEMLEEGDWKLVADIPAIPDKKK